ncbi:MAG: hypothetical protein PHY47_00605 [Lachnospiraceae bacterium]|nr:hypothetical protein [Lachnospiraceae bacterium]
MKKSLSAIGLILCSLVGAVLQLYVIIDLYRYLSGNMEWSLFLTYYLVANVFGMIVGILQVRQLNRACADVIKYVDTTKK